MLYLLASLSKCCYSIFSFLLCVLLCLFWVSPSMDQSPNPARIVNLWLQMLSQCPAWLALSASENWRDVAGAVVQQVTKSEGRSQIQTATLPASGLVLCNTAKNDQIGALEPFLCAFCWWIWRLNQYVWTPTNWIINDHTIPVTMLRTFPLSRCAQLWLWTRNKY
jgi:hypothetical protein